MNNYQKEEYLSQVKNRMLFHFSHKDIRLTLEDLNSYFESGTANGRAEAELCNELGTPEKFISGILQEVNQNTSHKKYKYALSAAYIICCCIFCALCFRAVQSPSQLRSYIAILIIPAFLWYSFGGHCLFQIRHDNAKGHKKYWIYIVVSGVFVILQQLLATLVYHDIHVAVSALLTTHYFSYLLVIVSFGILLITAYKLYKGYYLSCGILFFTVGTICSALLYNDRFVNYVGQPDSSLLMCILPFAAGTLLGAFSYFSMLKIKAPAAS